MTIGQVRANGDPVIRLTVARSFGSPRREHDIEDIETVLDTGFNGYLALPPGLIEALGLRQTSREVLTLANGEKHISKQYEAMVAFGGLVQIAEVLEAAEPLVGAALLWDYKVCIDYTEGGRVEIEALP